MGDYINDYSKVVGKYAKDNILENEWFRAEKLLEKFENDLSFNIDNNHRAVSLYVTGDTGVSYLLKPNDYVDVISYIAEKKENNITIHPDIAKIILQNIKLLAIDRQLVRDEQKDSNAKDDKKITNFLVTLSVPTSEVEKLVLAQSIGSIKLVLRPLKENDIAKEHGITREELINNDKTTTEAQSSPKNITYTVKPKDTLKSISEKFYGTPDKYTIIQQKNNIENKNLIKAGQVLIIP